MDVGNMQTIQFKCPHCGQAYEADASDMDTEAMCEKCGQTFKIADVSAKIVTNRPTGFGCYLGVFKKYFAFKGRMDRRTYWWAVLFNCVFFSLASFVDILLFDEYDDNQNLVAGLFMLVTLFPMLAAPARRLHDTNKSGWWIFLVLLPPLNIAYFIWLVQKGDTGENRFGPPCS